MSRYSEDPTPTPETDALLMKLSAEAKLPKEEMQKLIDAGYVKRERVSYAGKETKLVRQSSAERRVERLKVDALEEKSDALVKAAITAIKAKLGTDYKFERHNGGLREDRRFFVKFKGETITLKLNERYEGSGFYSTRPRAPKGQFDCYVGNWDNQRRFPARKAGIPVDDIVAEIMRCLAYEIEKKVVEQKQASAEAAMSKLVDALHKELGIDVDGYQAPRLEVSDTGEVKLRLPTLTFNQAEALLRLAKELGL
jgi:hypothetical protein